MRSDRKRSPSAQEPQREGGWGRAVQSPGRERCSLQKSCSQHFFFFVRRRGAKRGTAAGRAQGKAEMGGGGSAVILAKSLFPLADLPAGGLCAGRVPSQDPAPGAWAVSGTAPSGPAPTAWPRAPPRPGGNAQTTSRGGNQDPGTIPTWAAESEPSQGEPFSRSHSAPTKQLPELPLGSSAPPKPDHGEFWQHQRGRALGWQLQARERAELRALPSIPETDGAG